MDNIIRMYNYRLETGTVGTDDENIASVLYTINQLEMTSLYSFSKTDEADEALGDLLFRVLDAKVHMNRFLDAAGDKADAEAAQKVISRFDEAMEIVRTARDNKDAAEMSTAFLSVYEYLLKIVPDVLSLDAQVAGR